MGLPGTDATTSTITSYVVEHRDALLAGVILKSLRVAPIQFQVFSRHGRSSIHSLHRCFPIVVLSLVYAKQQTLGGTFTSRRPTIGNPRSRAMSAQENKSVV